MTSKSLLIWTLPFVLLAHYVAVFPHELTHSFFAWFLGYKSNSSQHPIRRDQPVKLLLLSGVDENVDYQTIFQQNPYHVALIAFAGPGIANGGMFLLSYWLLQKQQVQDRPHLYYFVLWFNLMNIANLFDYIPFRTFTPVNWDTDMSNLERGLNISPWVVYVVGGYLVMFVIWQFFSKTLVESYVYLGLKALWIRSFLLISAVLVLFGYFSSAGLHGYGEISAFLSTTSRWICPAIIVCCWPDRQWVREKMAVIKQAFSSEEVIAARHISRPEMYAARSL